MPTQSHAVLNPAVIIEVLSNSTEHLDKTHKTRCYKQIPSLRQMIFVAQDEMHVRILEKEGENGWTLNFMTQKTFCGLATAIFPYRKYIVG